MWTSGLPSNHPDLFCLLVFRVPRRLALLRFDGTVEGCTGDIVRGGRSQDK